MEVKDSMVELGGETKQKTITIKLGCTFNTDKYDSIIKDIAGNVTYDRHDTLALSQMFSAIDIRSIPIDRHADWIMLAKKVKTAFKIDSNELVLTIDEAAFLKDFAKLAFPFHPDVKVLGTFYAETLQSLREQLK